MKSILQSNVLRRMKDAAEKLESTDPIYLTHREKILGMKGLMKITKPRLDTRG